jgi:hypothetical protein
VFTGNSSAKDQRLYFYDQETIVGVETGHVELDESWQVADYPNATVLPGLIDTMFILVCRQRDGCLDRVAGLGDEELDLLSPTGCGASWRPG